ncbi:MAG: hypothetical protein F4Y71_02675 [Acidobacteria bacterium]|nr:hypothetical protein [Acidobacteriota bacterium]
MTRRFVIWNRTPLVADWYVVLAVVAALVVWTWCFDGSDYIDKTLEGIRVSIYRVTMGIAASLLGFSLTVMSVVLGFSSYKRLAIVRKSKHYRTVWRTFFAAVHALGLLLLCAFLALVFDREERPVLVLEVAYAALCLLAGLRLYRSVWILRRLVDLIAKPNTQTD